MEEIKGDIMTDYVIAIPSYKRAETVKTKTLALLEKYNIDPSIVTVFVANEEEKQVYQQVLKDTKYTNIVVGIVGMGAIRNFIQQYYPEGTHIVNMDDDLIEIQLRETEKKLVPHPSLDRVIREGFAACIKNNSYLWGIYAASNPFFMKEEGKVANGLYYIIGSFWGCINRHGDKFNVSLDDKEDYERTLKYYDHDKVVSRLDYITVKSNYYKEPGGMQVERTAKRIEESAKILVERFPNYCTMYYRETTGHAELKLRDKGPKAPTNTFVSLDSLFE